MKVFAAVVVILTLTDQIHCCSTDTECPSTDFICTNEQCTCKEGYLLSSDKLKCLPYVTEYKGICSENGQCEWLGENSECDYVCKCKKEYRWYLGECKKYVSLGEICQADIDCYDGYNPQSLRCIDNKCTCSDGYYIREGTDCRKNASKENDICALDMDCKFSNTECHIGKCRSKTKTAFLEEEYGDEEIDEIFPYQITATKSCGTTDDCADIVNSECYEKTGMCICKKKYFFNKDATECVPEIGVNVGCKSDTDCEIRPGKCVDGVCYCRDYYFVDDGNRNCVKSISQNNWNCISKEWCYALGKYSFCSSSETCKCSKLSDYDEQGTVCRWNGKEDPAVCTSDYECMYIKNGYCIDEACGCQENFVLQNNSTCVPNIGAPCDVEMGCPIENSECIDGICECVDGYVAYQNASCHLKRNYLEEECEVDIQCSVNILHSKCIDGKCNCDELYTPYNNDSCLETKKHGSYCNNLFECQLSLGKTFACRNRICQCPTGYTLKENECSSSEIISINIFVIAIVLILKSVLSVFC